ncbi:MAG: endonuclease/exonuclease/phosphatase family protein [Flavobacteriaceae bacterium]|nr:endonuclease/exonuclease/phosphatase family protein [Flavobacteriaceae bacterium]
MKKIKSLKKNLIFLFTLYSLSLNSQFSSAMSYNIRYANSSDGINKWENRKDALTNLLNYYNPDIIGLQEALFSQIKFINSRLPLYNKIGIAREDGLQKGEYSPILYNVKKFKLLASNTFWLSNTPDSPTIGWDAAHKRICTYGKFQNINTKQHLWVFNTHFDHLGEIARLNSAKLILKMINSIVPKNDKLLLLGDLNCLPNSAPINEIKSYLEDGLLESKKKLYGPFGTFNNFNPNHPLKKNRIDYIFVKNISVINYRHINDKMTNSNCISDHLPVLISFKQ